MRLQASTDYAIRILQHLHNNRGDVQTATNIADATGVGRPYVMKLVTQLKNAELLSTVHGRNGGYMLGKPANEISLYDVFTSVEGELQLKDGLQSEPDTADNAAYETHTFFSDLQSKLITEMSKTYIADLAS